MPQARAMNGYLRDKSAIGNSLRELMILITAGSRDAMSPDEQIVYDHTIELLKKKQISDATFAGNHCASRRRSLRTHC